jgi:putative ABC transport system permease protein
MLRDFRYAFRVLSARPAFTLVAALSLALGIGANSAIFGLIDALWLRPLAVVKPANIVRLFSVTDQDREAMLSYPEFLDFQKQATRLSDVMAIGGRGAIFVQGDAHHLVTLNLVSSNFFTALGVKPAVGRVFTPQDEAATPGALVVVLGNDFWQRQFAANPNIVGQSIHLQRANNMLATVIGVLPASFREVDPGGDRDLWFPHQAWAVLGNLRELESRGNRWFHVIGRLAPGASVASANAQIQTIAQTLAATWPADNRGRRATVISDLSYRWEQAGSNGLALLAIVFLVVLISSVNVANLLLSRAGFRGREMAVRLALGARRNRLVRQLMTENLLLGAAGLVLGLALGALLIAILPSLIVQPPGLHSVVDFEFDTRVFGFTLAISLATVLFFGLAPAWKSTRPDLIPALKGEAAFGPSGHSRWPLRKWLAVVQVAVSMTLLACAGVLVQSFANTRSSDLGFGRKQLLLVWLAADDAKPSLYREIVSRYQGLPGVRSVAAAVRAPLSLSSNGMFQRVSFPGRTDLAGQPPFEIKYNSITANFLQTMGTPVLRGRAFDPVDERPGANHVLINQQMAQRFWPGQDALGKTIRIGGSNGPVHTVVGVVKNAPINAVGETPEPYLYLSYWANFEGEVTFLVETSGDAAALAQPARSTLKSVDSRLDPLTITTQNDLIRFSAQRYQITAELVGALGLLGLILTAVGVYGVVSYGVSQRTRELGIRMALGAGRLATLNFVLREVLIVGCAGISVGLPLALTGTHLFSSLLFGVSPVDVPAFVIAAAVLAIVLLAAGFLPARRATTIDPASSLRVV